MDKSEKHNNELQLFAKKQKHPVKILSNYLTTLYLNAFIIYKLLNQS